MIARLWHGWTKAADADTYQAALLDKILPEMHRVKGYHGGHVLRKDDGDETEFIVLTFWESITAVKEFAGANLTKPVITPAAAKVLTRGDEKATHYTSFRSE
jgi:heme-degrading monooxygenase HmoA